jgi:hypothetical protein
VNFLYLRAEAAAWAEKIGITNGHLVSKAKYRMVARQSLVWPARETRWNTTTKRRRLHRDGFSTM